MEKINVEHLGRAGAGIAEKIGYERGVKDTLNYVSKFLDEDTVQATKELLLGEENETEF